MILGVDTGGTFTDFALLGKTSDNSQPATLRTHKVLSSPDAPERAILQGIIEMGLAEQVQAGTLKIIHGSTVATNAVLEGKGVTTAFVTNRGLKDMLSIARQTRPQLYQLESPPQLPPVPDELCLETGGRVDAQGKTLEPLTLEDMQVLVQQLEDLKPEAIAINLLFSFLDSSHEIKLEEYLQQHLSWPAFISRSSFVLPEYKEYERGIATWLNASLGPLVESYLLRLKTGTQPSPLSVMQSSGGTIDAEQASKKSVNLLLSGPAGGLAAVSFLAKTLNQPHLMTFDMGGTSTDVALVSNGNIKLSNEGHIGRYPVAVPMVDMHTIGAGGGSIAYVDEGKLLQVGPQSAGAKPGPACYGLGGTQASVTDANLVLGRLLPSAFMGGQITLSVAAAQTAISDIAKKLALTSNETAEGIIKIANEHMVRALRSISVEQGYDPKTFRLCCFGGAGGLHICALADALEMTQALVPIHAGVLSALGMFLAPIERQLSLTHQCLLKDINKPKLEALFDKLKQEAIVQIMQEQVDPASINIELSADIRYEGQSDTLNIIWSTLKQVELDFHHLHKARYGHQLTTELTLINIRVAAKSQSSNDKVQHSLAKLPPLPNATPSHKLDLYGFKQQVSVYPRRLLAPGQSISGPALISETNSTTLIDTHWAAQVDEFGNLLLQK